MWEKKGYSGEKSTLENTGGQTKMDNPEKLATLVMSVFSVSFTKILQGITNFYYLIQIKKKHVVVSL